MSPQVIEAAMEGIARNREQERLAFNPDDEVNSLLEHVRELARDATAAQRPHIQALLDLIRRLCESNRAELHCERMIAATADCLAETGWSVKRAARELRDPLATLCSPIIGEDAKDKARAEVARIVKACPRDVLVDGDSVRKSLGNELRDRKTTALRGFLFETQVAI